MSDIKCGVKKKIIIILVVVDVVVVIIVVVVVLLGGQRQCLLVQFSFVLAFSGRSAFQSDSIVGLV